MYEIAISSDAPVSRVQKCIKELEHKAIWSEFDIESRSLKIDVSESNTDDIKGTIISILGIDNIDEFRDTSLNIRE